jgi:multidrug efflux pump subunit AcrB
VARLEFESAPPVIQRFNRERSVTVTAFARTGFNVNAVTRRDQLLLIERKTTAE